MSVLCNTQKETAFKEKCIDPTPWVFHHYKDRYQNNPSYILDTTGSQHPYCVNNEQDL